VLEAGVAGCCAVIYIPVVSLQLEGAIATTTEQGRGRVHKDGVMLEVVRGREALVIEFSR
jgi:hypothetical protein